MASNETNLPYVGTKVSIRLENGERVEVVIHTSGMRDLIFYGSGDRAPEHLVRLDPTSACALGALLCAAIQHPPTG